MDSERRFVELGTFMQIVTLISSDSHIPVCECVHEHMFYIRKCAHKHGHMHTCIQLRVCVHTWV